MKASTAEGNNYVCPVCGSKVARVHKGQGFARHIEARQTDSSKRKNRFCDFEKGEQDRVIENS